jgi:hypothetical protein
MVTEDKAMVAKGNADKHRYSMSGLKVQEEEKWGRAKAEERGYGPLKFRDGAPRPEDQSRPQKLGDSNNLQGNRYSNDTPNDWRRGATTKPGFDRGK